MTYVIIPTYNESGNIARLVEEIGSLALGLRVLIVDDNSPDGTGEIADTLAQKYAFVEVLHNSQKDGLGRAYLRGFEYVWKRGTDRVIKMDADLSHQARYIPLLLRAAKKYDLVLGSRFDKGGRLIAVWHRRFLSRLANLFVSFLFGLGVSDATTGFHCLSKKVLQTVLDKGVISRGFAFQVELVYLTRQAGLEVGGIPIEYISRESGRSKMNWGEVWGGIVDLLRLKFCGPRD
ncbi:polyprenol monophosphomannose synthase [Patescibacteria group bacterium]|nr:polyprenol monophosphomannose synthase [Patescibacteria group bacterium]